MDASGDLGHMWQKRKVWESEEELAPKSHKSLADEGMTPRSSIFAYPVPSKEEARSNDT
jgi:hypothetical protein